MRHARALLAATMLAVACDDPAQPDRQNPAAPGTDVTSELNAGIVTVAPPTGNAAADVASIEAAVASAGPGDVIKFAPGAYQIEEETRFVVSQPGVTLLGHGSGSWIRGPEHIFAPDALDGHFQLNGGNQTVRQLNFDGFATAVAMGERPGPGVVRTGGYRVENVTFLNGDLPLEYRGNSDDISVFRGNRFINVTIPFLIVGKTVHVLGNTNLNPEPENASAFRPFNAGILFAGPNVCENNLLEGNTVVGNADGFILVDCHNNTVRKNKFVDQVLFPGDDVFESFDSGSMVVGISPDFQNNLIERNELHGSPGIGIAIEEGTGNQILDNKFHKVTAGDRAPFEGSLLGLDLGGTGVLLFPGTTGNQVCRNSFTKVTTAVVNLGENLVCARDAADAQLMAKRPSADARVSQMENPKLRLLRQRLSLPLR